MCKVFLVVCMYENVGEKNDVAAVGELLEMRVRFEEKELLFSIVGDPAPLMNLQENFHHKQICSQPDKYWPLWQKCCKK